MTSDSENQPAGTLRAASGERDDIMDTVAGTSTATRWRKLAGELSQAADAIAETDEPMLELRQRIGWLACVEALAQGISERWPRD